MVFYAALFSIMAAGVKSSNSSVDSLPLVLICSFVIAVAFYPLLPGISPILHGRSFPARFGVHIHLMVSGPLGEIIFIHSLRSTLSFSLARLKD